VPENIKNVWNRMNQIIITFMLEEFPDADKHLVLAGEASLDSTWPITSPGVPSIRMLHNHFIVFDKTQLENAELSDPKNPNLTDGGQHSLFGNYMKDVYAEFQSKLNFEILKPIEGNSSGLSMTGYPQGLPSWEITGGIDSLKNMKFWNEYDLVLKGFLDFYRTFFSQVSCRNSAIPKEVYFPELIKSTLLFDNRFLSTAKKVRDQCIDNPKFSSSIRWQPAFKQLIYRNDQNKLIVTISQNSIGNAITELLGVVVKRVPDTKSYEKAEPALLEKLLRLRAKLIEADLGEGIETKYWKKD
jgi:hypothetical protein